MHSNLSLTVESTNAETVFTKMCILLMQAFKNMIVY